MTFDHNTMPLRVSIEYSNGTVARWEGTAAAKVEQLILHGSSKPHGYVLGWLAVIGISLAVLAFMAVVK